MSSQRRRASEKRCARPAGYAGALQGVYGCALPGKTRKALEEKRAELALTY